jgi:hypothetical protein
MTNRLMNGLQSGFDGNELLTRPSIELVTINADVIRRAEQQIESCEHCHPDDADIPFDWILAEVTGEREIPTSEDRLIRESGIDGCAWCSAVDEQPPIPA